MDVDVLLRLLASIEQVRAQAHEAGLHDVARDLGTAYTAAAREIARLRQLRLVRRREQREQER